MPDKHIQSSAKDNLVVPIEKPIVFTVNNNQLVGVYHQAYIKSAKAVVIVVGGPQTRVGSHRQFVLLARALAKQGVHVFRFDYAGAGDSEGQITPFTDLSDNIKAAIDILMQQHNEIKSVNLWGLCDAASAILLYLAETSDTRVKQLTLLNPWVRQPSTQAQTYLRSYYIKRLFEPSFWQKLFQGKFKLHRTLGEIKQFKQQSEQVSDGTNFVEKMLSGAVKFNGYIDVILSGNDLTAAEFNLLISTHIAWKKLFKQKNIQLYKVAAADHTFSHESWHHQMVALSLKNIK